MGVPGYPGGSGAPGYPGPPGVQGPAGLKGMSWSLKDGIMLFASASVTEGDRISFNQPVNPDPNKTINNNKATGEIYCSFQQ